MPEWPSRPSTTIARRCDASCTDRHHAPVLPTFAPQPPRTNRGRLLWTACRDEAHSVCDRYPVEVCYRRQAVAHICSRELLLLPEAVGKRAARARGLTGNASGGVGRCAVFSRR